jgi:hypothetical protein
MGEMRNVYKVLVRKPEGKRPLGRSRRRWEDNIKMDLKEIWFEVVNWIHLAQNRDRWRALVDTALKGQLKGRGSTLTDFWKTTKKRV